MLLQHVDRALWEGAGRRVIEEDLLTPGGPRKLAGAKRADINGQGSTSVVGTPVAAGGAATSMRRGSSASRSASPSRLKPSTAAPIASPGNTDVHGACRSWYRSRPSAIIAPQLGVGGWTPKP